MGCWGVGVGPTPPGGVAVPCPYPYWTGRCVGFVYTLAAGFAAAMPGDDIQVALSCNDVQLAQCSTVFLGLTSCPALAFGTPGDIECRVTVAAAPASVWFAGCGDP